MAGDVRTCTNCGSQQATGTFCERCGTRLPELAGAQRGTMYPNQYVPQPQYYAPRPPGTLSRLFDLSFQGFVTRGSLRGLFTSVLALLGAYWFFALIFGIIAAAKYQGIWCIVIFSSLILVTLMIIWTRILMELTMTVTEMRAEMQQAAQMAEAREAKLAAAVKAAEATKRPAAGSPAKAATKASPRSASSAAAKKTSTRSKK